MPRIAVWVSNDLSFDQRVQKTCQSLNHRGWTPVLVGREMPGMKPWQGPWEAQRLRVKAQRGIRFYALWQWALWKWVRRHGEGFDAIWCNDLDTLAPALVWGQRPVVYDSHEYFTEAAGLTGKPVRRSVWLMLERWCMSRLTSMITVNESIAEAYRRKYGVGVEVVRNMPVLRPPVVTEGRSVFDSYDIPSDVPIVLMQGAYMDRDRGTAEAVAALPHVPGIRLVLVGAGIEWEEACDVQGEERFEGRLHCLPKMPFEELRILTASADVGLSLDKSGHGNYEMSLPNKLFDFMHAGLPMVTTARAEVAKVVEGHGLGVVVTNLQPETLRRAIVEVLSVPRKEWASRAEEARNLFHWGVDEPKLFKVLDESLKAHLRGSQKA